LNIYINKKKIQQLKVNHDNAAKNIVFCRGDYFFLKKNETEPKPGQTDWFRFGSVRFLGQKPVWLSFLDFGLVFFCFGSVFLVWLGFSGLALFFSGFLSVSVRFGFFGFLFIKPKPNRPVFSKI